MGRTWQILGLVGEIANNVMRGLQNVGQSFINQLVGLFTVISAQGVSQVVGSFDGEPMKLWDWIKSIEKYVLLAGRDDSGNQSKGLLARPAGVSLVITFRGIWLSTQKTIRNNEYLS